MGAAQCRSDADNGSLRVPTPPDFAFPEVLAYLTRSSEECLFRVVGERVFRWVNLPTLSGFLELSDSGMGGLEVSVSGSPSRTARQDAASYVREWFDLDRDLSGFYELAASEPILDSVVQAHRGLRIVGVPDLFEALGWAVIGQQINLAFAYTLKRRFVETFGARQQFGGEWYWHFPAPERIANLSVKDLQDLQLTRRKSEYLVGIAQAMCAGQVSRARLLGMEPQAAHQALREMRGVGEWTASYVAMRCLFDMSAFPVGDVGLQNAVKSRLGFETKPRPDELRRLGERWSGWEAYATFYLWRSLAGYSA